MAGPSRWEHVHALHYPGMTVDMSRLVARFDFALVGAGEPLRFTETVTFPAPAQPPPPAALETFHRVLQLLYVAMGTSYYKVAAPPQVVFDGVPLADKALPWATGLFRLGMGEFAYRNHLPHVLDVELVAEPHPPAATGYDLTTRPPLVAVGGGKDSIVSVEALREFDPVLMSVNPNAPLTAVLDTAGRPYLHATRAIDRRLLDLNRAGAYNGHVPVTAINSLVAVATAVLHGLGPVVMSNERSASVPNLTWHGRQINHQWSKGIDAEALQREALAAHAGLAEAYFSLLRPLSELHIARVFAPFTTYDTVVTSCNAAFRLSGRTAGWCGNCPKCRFVFVALAPFMPRARLVDIFGADLLADEQQLPGYRELAGVTHHKPFECVGETEETLAAFRMLAERPEWADAPVLQRLRTEVADPSWLSDEALARVFRPEATTYAPQRYAQALENLMRSVGAWDAPA